MVLFTVSIQINNNDNVNSTNCRRKIFFFFEHRGGRLASEGKARRLEWWYFDALSEDGRDAVVIIFLDNFIFSPRYNSQTKRVPPSASSLKTNFFGETGKIRARTNFRRSYLFITATENPSIAPSMNFPSENFTPARISPNAGSGIVHSASNPRLTVRVMRFR